MLKFNPVMVAFGVAASLGVFESALAQDVPKGAPASVVVLPFATLGSPPQDEASLPNRACIPPQGAPPPPAGADAITAAVQSGLPGLLTAALSRNVHDGARAVYNDLQSAPPGAVIIAGCIVRADPGDPAKRLVGLGMGASVLAVQVQVYRGLQPRADLIGEFDTEVQGENKLPPIGPVGLAVHGIRGRKLNLKADADKLAKLIAGRVMTGQFGS